jgi:hypothetical protein
VIKKCSVLREQKLSEQPSQSEFARSENITLNGKVSQTASQIARLNAMAAALRLEAAELEVSQKKVEAANLAKVFDSFDINKDG